MSSTVGAHHRCFTNKDGLAWHAAAPSIPPIIETAAAGLWRRTHEQTVSLLKTITAAARAISTANVVQLPFTAMQKERAFNNFLQSCCLCVLRVLCGKKVWLVAES